MRRQPIQRSSPSLRPLFSHSSGCRAAAQIGFGCSHVAPRPERDVRRRRRAAACWPPGKTNLSGFDSSSVGAAPTVAVSRRHNQTFPLPSSPRFICRLVGFHSSNFYFKLLCLWYLMFSPQSLGLNGIIPQLTSVMVFLN